MLIWTPYNAFSQDTIHLHPKQTIITDTLYLAFNKEESIYLYNSLIERDQYLIIINEYEQLTIVLEDKNNELLKQIDIRDSTYDAYVVQLNLYNKKILRKEKRKHFIYAGGGFIVGIITILILL
jgi:hypothetical protein